MTLFDTHRPTEEDKSGPKPGANKQPLIEPKRIILRSKPAFHSGDYNRRPASIFRRRPTSPREARNLPDAALAVKTEARLDKRCIPDMRLRTLASAGKYSPLFKLQGESRPNSSGVRNCRACWDSVAVFSLDANAIQITLILFMAIQNINLKTIVIGLPIGLCRNIVEMDKASITTSVGVDMQVPIDFMLPIQQNQDHDASNPTPGVP